MMDAIAFYSIIGIYSMGYFAGKLDEEENISSAWALPLAILWPILVIGVSIFRLWKWWRK
ncbi:hypothetical protein AXW37_12290 [Yersinia ruckeri]|uniref:hypothetical protein n=1 Tax=Yersinia TaxID=629 RepID=UPI0008FE184D|nr:hypothetical protein [Yersinia ruckeri]ELI8162714.1 hypothetical protein [Yersinia enterocolitica]ELZ0587184.1 hypothetical protein [Yersinia enterocolitica]OJC57053.1 hypothetical protein AXW37_12290 [Yersinia ruckeri]OJC85893.1 hypothetical protein AXW45_12230 [Yersinia ruckeri]HDL7937198.1 hypothetical protein [Yersinia enterocolitica]